MELFFQCLKRELLHVRVTASKARTSLELFECISYCNRRRRHSALGHLAPIEFGRRSTASATLALAA